MENTSYILSNAMLTIPNLSISIQSKNLYKKFREVAQISQEELQWLSNSICSDLRISTIPVFFEGIQPHNTRESRINRKTLGNITSNSSRIKIYKYTAARKQQLAPKTAIATLLHELNHHIDYQIFNLSQSLHTKGFYMRLSHLENTLKV